VAEPGEVVLELLAGWLLAEVLAASDERQDLLECGRLRVDREGAGFSAYQAEATRAVVEDLRQAGERVRLQDPGGLGGAADLDGGHVEVGEQLGHGLAQRAAHGLLEVLPERVDPRLDTTEEVVATGEHGT